MRYLHRSARYGGKDAHMPTKPALAIVLALACGQVAASHDFCVTRSATGVKEILRAQLAFGADDPGRDGAAIIAIEHFRQGAAWTVHLDDVGAEECIGARTVVLAPAVRITPVAPGTSQNPNLVAAVRMATGLPSGVYMEIGRHAGNLTRSLTEVTHQMVCTITGC
jgi:hypothetical protein